MNDDDPVLKFVHVSLVLSAARKEALKANGLTEDGYRELHEQAVSQMGDADELVTAIGTLKKRVTTIYANKSPVPIGTRVKLFATNRKE